MRCYMDVDGVNVPSGGGFGGFDDFELRGWGVPISERMTDEVAALELHLVWLTTWCDDALNSHGQGVQAQLETLGVPHLLICPPAHTGLGPEELERMRKFAGRYAT